ncbi:hypothetical protein [Solibacillus isronensis]|nr:hypothetical protein [Solibacillus isronensis]
MVEEFNIERSIGKEASNKETLPLVDNKDGKVSQEVTSFTRKYIEFF